MNNNNNNSNRGTIGSNGGWIVELLDKIVPNSIDLYIGT
jgi:hypothetical protein